MQRKLKKLKIFNLECQHFLRGFMECILHLAYHLPFRKWSTRNDKDKVVIKELEKIMNSKIRIQEQLKKRWLCMQMFQSKKLEQAKTFSGNTARKFFRNSETTLSIIGIDENLIRRFSIILQTLACRKKIDADKFGKYISETAKLYVELMTMILHAISS